MEADSTASSAEVDDKSLVVDVGLADDGGGMVAGASTFVRVATEEQETKGNNNNNNNSGLTAGDAVSGVLPRTKTAAAATATATGTQAGDASVTVADTADHQYNDDTGGEGSSSDEVAPAAAGTLVPPKGEQSVGVPGKEQQGANDNKARGLLALSKSVMDGVVEEIRLQSSNESFM